MRGGLRVGSLFSGVEGFGQGLEAAGFEVAWQVEIDKDAVSVLERHYPTVRRYRDVREVIGSDLSPVDVLVGGFPCQDLSVAGRRQGLAGERSGLFFEIVRIARESATRWLLLENVPGLLSSFTPVEPSPRDVPVGTEWTVEETSDLGVVVSTLQEHGYLGCLRVLDAQHFGVAQRRERVFIVGCLGDSGARATEVLLESESVLWDLASCLATGQGAPGVPEDGAGSGGVTTVSIQYGARPREFSQGLGVTVNTPCYTLDTLGEHAVGVFPEGYVGGQGVRDALTAHGGSHGRIDAESETFVVANTLRAGHHGYDAPRGDGSDNLVVAAFDERNVTSGAIRTRCEPGLPANTLHAEGQAIAFHATQSPVNGHVAPALGASSQIGVANLGVTHSLTTRSGATEDGTGRGTPRAACPGDNGWAVRRLMPVEAERLMGWPDDWTRFRADGSLIPDGPRYRLIGNGVVAPVARWIGQRLRRVMEATP